jgi:flagellar hook assembly protein FlgD
MAPAYWDGRDDNGNPLPMGTYLIVVGKKEMINITIIK